MDNHRSIIKALYLDIPYDLCLKPYYDFEHSLKENLENTHKAYNKQYTDSEHGHIVSYALDHWIKPKKKCCFGKIFLPLYEFAKEVLVESGCGVTVRFKHILRWQESTTFLGEDIFTTAFLAYKDVYGPLEERTAFNWPLISSHNHSKLNEITHQGLPEMHFHLKGSSANFELNWLCLMNHIENREGVFKEMKKILREEQKTTQDQKDYTLHEKCIKAAALRLFFYNLLMGHKAEVKEKRYVHTEKEASNYVISKVPAEIQKLIYTEFCMQEKKPSQSLDYALSLQPRNMDCDHKTPLQAHHDFVTGERKLMYGMFKALFGNQFPNHPEYEQLFYTYLCIKASFRKEFVQINDNIGFENFGHYQDRKTLFIKSYKQYEKKLEEYAINGVLEQPEVDYLETRIAPEMTCEELYDSIKKYTDPYIKSKLKEEESSYNITLHFIKQADESNCEKDEKRNCKSRKYTKYQERHCILRSQVKQQSLVIAAFRKRKHDIGKYLVGIDAANTEIGCRPEVFAQAYRYLRKEQGLHFTFHAGEDYYDITDGLRAVDEAIHLLNLANGDRIGHGLALGADAKAYYMRKRYTITCTKQDLLDDLVWCICKSEGLGINMDTQLKAFMKERIQTIASELGYGQHSLDINCYYSSMHLRGDNPKANQEEAVENLLPPHTWNTMDFNFNLRAKTARKNKHAKKMYTQYHYDSTIREKGAVMTEICYPKSYSQFVTDLQEAMLEELDKFHIGIECNPTSNLRIGALEKYENHPIFRFHNDGIAKDGEPVHSLSVSINTDDQGVFSTSLPHEYALIAAAMEKKKDENDRPYYNKSQIYSWIKEIRSSAIEQRFKKKYK